MASYGRKSAQISFKVDEKTRSGVQKATNDEDLKVADFVRKIFRWGFEQYERAGSLHALRRKKISI